MIVLFLSPYFPPNARSFCKALSRRGVCVLGIGDVAVANQSAAAANGLTEYVFEPEMGDYATLHRAVAQLVKRHGALDRLDSNGEHWLEAEGRLRDDFSVSGLSLQQTRSLRSKLCMGRVFERAGVPYPASISSAVPEEVRRFAGEQGFPLVFKPDAGSGAVDTFVVNSAAELDTALPRSLPHHLVQPFIAGDIVTFDGLTDAAGKIVFCTSHRYDRGIMQVRAGALDGHYYSLRDIPPELERVGRSVVAAFEIRERFFHVEFFAREDGSYVGLEMNVRPPGGFTTDMMSAACDFDVYDLWAAVLSGASLSDLLIAVTFTPPMRGAAPVANIVSTTTNSRVSSDTRSSPCKPCRKHSQPRWATSRIYCGAPDWPNFAMRFHWSTRSERRVVLASRHALARLCSSHSRTTRYATIPTFTTRPTPFIAEGLRAIS